MSELPTPQQFSEPIPPFQRPVAIHGEYINPPPVQVRGIRGLLGRVGLGSTVQAEAQAVREQRATFVRDVIDRLEAPNESGRLVTELEALGRIDVYPQDYEAVGYVETDLTLTLNQELDESFEKENNPELNVLKREGYDWFRVVDDRDGDPWLLKIANKQGRRIGRGLYELHQASAHLHEVFAARIGDVAGYPIPETRPVFYDNMPWLAIRYVKDHQFLSIEDEQKDVVDKAQTLSNPEALRTRHIFNALIGAAGDNVNQGLVDPAENKYYAVDIPVTFDERHMTDDVSVIKQRFIDGFRDPMAFLNIGIATPLNAADKAFATTMLDTINRLKPSQAKEIFAYGRGKYADAEQCLQHLKNRATALKELLDEGFFDQRK